MIGAYVALLVVPGDVPWAGVAITVIAWLLILPAALRILKRARPPARDLRVFAARRFVLVWSGAIIAFMCVVGLYQVYKDKGRIDSSDLVLLAEVYIPLGALATVVIVVGIWDEQRRAICYWEQRAERHHEKHLRRRHGSKAPAAENEADQNDDRRSGNQANDTHLPGAS